MVKKFGSLLLTAILAITLFSACQSFNEREIHGQWYSNSWTSNGEPIRMRAWMDFEEDGTYRAVFQDSKEQGEYWIDGYKLFTQAEGADKIVTRIKRLEMDTMVIGMNRGGNDEEILFVRGKVYQIGEPRPEE